MFAKVENGVVTSFPYTRGQLLADNPDVSFPADLLMADLAEWYAMPVTQLADPAYNPVTEYLVQGAPVLNGNAWEVTRVIVAKSQAQLDAEAEDSARADDLALLQANAQIRALLTSRPGAIDTYINTNVTDLASAKAVLKILAKTCAVLAHAIIN